MGDKEQYPDEISRRLYEATIGGNLSTVNI